uniref:Uncharacterized protein n=1 Tax=Oryza glumipatula TaxID=40148 RepID=A0A0D9YMZ3_9ORYZ
MDIGHTLNSIEEFGLELGNDAINIMNNPPKFKASNGGRINPPKAHKTTMVKNQAKRRPLRLTSGHLLPRCTPPRRITSLAGDLLPCRPPSHPVASFLAPSCPTSHLPAGRPPPGKPPPHSAPFSPAGNSRRPRWPYRYEANDGRPIYAVGRWTNRQVVYHDRYLSLILANDAIIIIPSGYKVKKSLDKVIL